MHQGENSRRAATNELRLGFVPLLDCAPVLVAGHLGLFARHGVAVRVSRELGWASVRDKLAYGELDAAHAPCGLPFALHFGLGVPRTPCAAPLILSRGGNAITLGRALQEAGVVDAATLAAHLRGQGPAEPPTFGVVSNCSTHAFLLRRWLAGAGLREDRDVRVVVVPPSQMPDHLKSGHLAGFCAGEPWNSLAVRARLGAVVATSADLAAGHLEKVLAVRDSVVRQRERDVVGLVAALLEACAWCGDPANRDALVRILAGPAALHQPAELLRAAWSGTGSASRGLRPGPSRASLQMADPVTGEPTAAEAAWILDHVLAGQVRPRPSVAELLRIHRPDLFQRAAAPSLSFSRSLHETEPENEKVHHPTAV